MTDNERAALIEAYRLGYHEVTKALDGITGRELDFHPAPGAWSPREIVHHLADAEMGGALRLRRLIAEAAPAIMAYDQEQYARTLFYDRPIEGSLEAFRAARATTADILERLSDAQWKRAGTHSEAGHYDVEGWLRTFAKHAHGHADQIRRARAAAGAGRG